MAEEENKETPQPAPEAKKTGPERAGYYVSDRSDEELEKLQRRKTLWMYLGSLCLAVAILLPIRGQEKLIESIRADKSWALSLSTLYLLLLAATVVFSVYVSVLGRKRQRIGRTLRAKDVPRDGLDKHTFLSYEFNTVLHVLFALAEIAVAIYGFDAWSILAFACALGSGGFCIASRMVLYRANAGHMTLTES